MDPVEREDFYAVNGYPTPEEWPGLYEAGGPQKAYDEIRQRGYELFRFPYDAPEAREGEMVVGMAKAVKNGNQVVAALGVALPNEHGYRCFEGSQQQWYLTKAEEEFIGKYLCMAVREIQRRMQF